MRLSRELWAVVLWGLVVGLGACRSDDTGLDDTADDAQCAADRYDPDHLTVVSGQLDEDEWDALLHETRVFYELLMGPDCLQAPIPSVFTWHPGSVTIDDETLDTVGFRKKGFIGSLSWTRPSLKVDSDRFVDGQEFCDDTEHFTFNNNNQDPSSLHTCLAYAVFREAGVPAPLCAFATVEINSEDLGVYSNVQPIKKAFLRQEFGNDEGDLYEGTASDFADEFLVTFDIKTDGSTLAPLEELTAALNLPDDALMGRLDELLDVEAFITFWAVEGLIGHWDGYSQGSNNFYVYHSADDGLLHFIPWGADAVYQEPTEDPLLTSSQLALRLYNHPEGRAAWYAETQRLLDEVRDEAWLSSEIDRMEALIAPHLRYPLGASDAVDEVRDFVAHRRETVQDVLDATPPSRPWSVPERMCLQPIGSVDASFDLLWGATLDGDPFAGDATLIGDLYGQPMLDDHIGALAGFDGDTPLLAVLGVDSNYTAAVQVVLLLPPDLQAGTYDVDVAAIMGVVMVADLTTQEDAELVALMGGEVVFDEVSFVPGEPISGRIDAILIPNIFE